MSIAPDEHVAALLPALINGTLDATVADGVRLHLAACATCRRNAKAWDAIAEGVRAAAVATEPFPDLMGPVWASLDGAGHAPLDRKETSTLADVTPLTLANGRASLDLPTLRPSVRRHAPRRWVRAAEVAAVAALVLLLVGLGFPAGRLFVAVADLWRAGIGAESAVPMSGGNAARTGEQPGPGPETEPGLLWRTAVGWSTAVGGVASNPVVADGIVYVGTDAFLLALDAKTGAERWRAPAASAEPAVVDGTVYAAAGDLLAIDAETGAERWRARIAGPFGGTAPAVADGLVYVGGGPGAPAPAVADGAIYASGSAFSKQPFVLQAFDAASGEERWRRDLDPGVVAMDAATGDVRWRFPIVDQHESTAAAAEGAVFVGSESGDLYALDAADGRLRWVRGDVAPWSLPSAAVSDGVVYRPGRMLEALNVSTGEPFGAFAVAIPMAPNDADEADRHLPPYWGNLVVADGAVYGVSHDGYLYALDAPTSAAAWPTEANPDADPVRWRVPVGVGSFPTPAVVDGVVYVAHADGSLRAYAAGGAPIPVATPPPDGCTVVPGATLPSDALRIGTLAGTPRAALTRGAPGRITTTEQELPSGPVPSEDAVAASTETMRGLNVCSRLRGAESYEAVATRAFAFYSDDFFRRFAADPSAIGFWAPHTGGIELRAMRVLPDGRVGGIRDGVFLVFVESDGRYLIDEFLLLEGSGDTGRSAPDTTPVPPSGTPIP